MQLDADFGLTQGATGIAFHQHSTNPVKIELVDMENNRIEKVITPSFITKIIPRAQVDQSILRNLQNSENKFSYDKREVEDFELNYTLQEPGNFSALISSRPRSRLYGGRRLQIRKYSSLHDTLIDNTIYLGRDWQADFQITFHNQFVVIRN